MSKKKGKGKKKAKKVQPLTASGGWCVPSDAFDGLNWSTAKYSYPVKDLPVFRAQRGGVSYPPASNFTSQNEGGDSRMSISTVSVHRLFNVASIVALGAAAFGNTVFGVGGLELVGAGLALYVGADLADDVLSG